jgi:hypothetical protein
VAGEKFFPLFVQAAFLPPLGSGKGKTTRVPSKEVKRMYKAQTTPRSNTTDDELVDVLTAISVVSMRLARKLTLLAGQSQYTEGGKSYGQNQRNGYVIYLLFNILSKIRSAFFTTGTIVVKYF